MAQKDSHTNPHPLAPSGTGNPPPTRVGTNPPLRGTPIPKKGPKGGGEPATAMHRMGILEPHGARHRIDVKLPGPQSPEAGATQANGRVIPAVMGQKQNFWAEGGEKW